LSFAVIFRLLALCGTSCFISRTACSVTQRTTQHNRSQHRCF
jgi:hypothetical protein